MGLERYLAYEELSKEKLQNHLNDRNKKIDLGFEMTLAYEIKHKDPAIKINGDTVINPCELFTLVSLPGAGKTNISEVIITCHIAASNEIELPDNFGIEVFPRGKKCLLIDTERPYDDNRVSLGRICKRLNIKTNSHLVVNDKLKDLTFRVFTELHELAERKAALAKLISSGEYEFVILDGVLDFVPGLNEEVEVKETILWLRALATKWDLSIITTIHPNKGTDTIAGHLGGYLYRYSRACLLIKSNENDKSVRELTPCFPQGKLSHCDIANFETVYFSWDREQMLMTSTTEPDEIKTPNYKGDIIRQVMNEFIINGKPKVLASEAKARYCEIVRITENTAKKHFQSAVSDGLLKSTGSTRSIKYILNEEDDVPF